VDAGADDALTDPGEPPHALTGKAMTAATTAAQTRVNVTVILHGAAGDQSAASPADATREAARITPSTGAPEPPAGRTSRCLRRFGANPPPAGAAPSPEGLKGGGAAHHLGLWQGHFLSLRTKCPEKYPRQLNPLVTAAYAGSTAPRTPQHVACLTPKSIAARGIS